MTTESSYVLSFEEVGSESVSKVGGKNASLGEMIARLKTEGIRVPGGFATTAEAYRVFLEAGNLREKLGKQRADLEKGTKSLEQAGKSIRRLFLKTSFPEGISKAVVNAYRRLCEKHNREDIEKTLGEKEKKMVYAKGGSKTTKNIDTPKRERRSFVLSDGEILKLALWARRIEEHYGKPMDIEWAKDGETEELFIVQALPETVQSQKEAGTLKTYSLKDKGERLLTGLSIGDAASAGKACLIKSAEELDQFGENAVLVTEMTDPDWVPIMKKAAGIVTDHGGRTCHAAIVSRELGIPAVVGTGEATDVLEANQKITISCAERDEVYIYEGILKFEEREVDLKDIPETPFFLKSKRRNDKMKLTSSDPSGSMTRALQ